MPIYQAAHLPKSRLAFNETPRSSAMNKSASSPALARLPLHLCTRKCHKLADSLEIHIHLLFSTLTTSFSTSAIPLYSTPRPSRSTPSHSTARPVNSRASPASLPVHVPHQFFGIICPPSSNLSHRCLLSRAFLLIPCTSQLCNAKTQRTESYYSYETSLRDEAQNRKIYHPNLLLSTVLAPTRDERFDSSSLARCVRCRFIQKLELRWPDSTSTVHIALPSER